MNNDFNSIICGNIHDAIREIYKRHPTGGDLHVVLDDLNCENEWLIRTGSMITKMTVPDEITDDDKRLYLKCLALLWSIPESERIDIIHDATKEFVIC